MPAYVPLPWLNSSDQFLKAIIAGGEHAAALSRSFSGSRQPRGDTTTGVAAGNPLLAAQAAALNAKTAQEAQDRAGAAQAQAGYADLIRRGASPQEAFERSGLAQFGQKEPTTHNPIEVSPGNQLIGMDPTSGKPSVLYTAPAKPAAKMTEVQVKTLAHRLRAGSGGMPPGEGDIADLNALAKEYPDWVTAYQAPAPPPAGPVESNAGGGFSFPNPLSMLQSIGSGGLSKILLDQNGQGSDTGSTNGLKIGKYTVQPVQ